MGEVALLIAAIAFAVLVIYVVLLIVKLLKIAEEANTTLKVLTSDANVTFYKLTRF